MIYIFALLLVCAVPGSAAGLMAACMLHGFSLAQWNRVKWMSAFVLSVLCTLVVFFGMSALVLANA